MLSVNNLSVEYRKGDTVIKDISFSLKKGNLLAIIGPNGVGKTTLLRCINGLIKPQKGIVKIEGKHIEEMQTREIAKKIGYVPQNNNAGNITVFDAVLLGRTPHVGFRSSKSDLNKVSDAMKQLKLEHLATRYTNQLSGGELKKVCIARTFAQEPKIFLLDEPTANLDLKHTIEIMNILKDLCNKGYTVVIALHDINLAARYASDILMLKEGEIFAQGGKEIITENNLEKLYDIKVRIIKNNDILHAIPIGETL